jgi:hypothetical protein
MVCAMELSLNSDINLGNDSFHIQTEDWGVSSPYIVSRIYKNGAVLKSIKTPYSEIIDAPIWDKQAVELAVKSQHDQLVEMLISGRA